MHNCAIVWTFFGTALLRDWNENWPFPVLWPVLSFQIHCHTEWSTLTASSFRNLNNSAGIPSPPLAWFVVVLPKAHLTSHSRMSGSRWVITPLWLSRSLRPFLYSSVYFLCILATSSYYLLLLLGPYCPYILCPSLHGMSPSVQSLSCVQLFATPWTTARQASLSITNSWSLLKLTSIESVMPSNHLILCCPLLLQPSIFPSIGVFSNESVLRIRWPKVLEFQLQHQSFQWTPRTDLL